MKRSAFLIAMLSFSASFAQGTYQIINVNNIEAAVPVAAALFNLPDLGSWYHAPSTAPQSTIFGAAPWIGGISNGQLYLAAETYRQAGQDLQQGPVNSSYSSSFLAQWDYIWKVTSAEITAFNDDFKKGKVNFSKYPAIQSWPSIAPYVDVNHDGFYDPETGDHPHIAGDMYLYSVMNDDMVHFESGGQVMNIEIHRAVYGYHSGIQDIDNTIFVDYRIVNRSDRTYDSTYFGSWVDFDIGNYADDFIGTDSIRSMVYAYNADYDDDLPMGYGSNPPVQACVMLNRQAGSSVYYRNDYSADFGNPTSPQHYYNYMKALNKSGQATASRFAFPGDPCIDAGFTEINTGSTPGDRRILLSTTPFTLRPGETYRITLAFVTALASNGPTASLCKVKQSVDRVRKFYNNLILGNDEPLTSERDFVCWPNPANDHIRIEAGKPNGDFTIRILDLQGRVISSFYNEKEITPDRSKLSSGMYLLQYEDGESVMTQKVVLN